MNQHCHKTRSLFGPYLDGDLGPRAVRRVDEHLGKCPACREELTAEKRVADTLSSMPRLACPQRVDHRIMDRLTEEPERRGLLGRVGLFLGSPGWKTVTACAAALMVVLLFLPADPERNPAGSGTLLTDHDGRITHQEAYLAREKAKSSLAYVANLIRSSEKETVNKILSKELPEAILNSLQRVVPVTKGESDS